MSHSQWIVVVLVVALVFVGFMLFWPRQPEEPPKIGEKEEAMPMAPAEEDVKKWTLIEVGEFKMILPGVFRQDQAGNVSTSRWKFEGCKAVEENAVLSFNAPEMVPVQLSFNGLLKEPIDKKVMIVASEEMGKAFHLSMAKDDFKVEVKLFDALTEDKLIVKVYPVTKKQVEELGFSAIDR